MSAAGLGLAPYSMTLAAQGAASKRRRPNVVIVLTDDQGYGDMSCHGNPVIKTPNIDRLHSESVRLTDFHAAPMCTPARGQLMTGTDAMANGATAVCQGRSMLRAELPTMGNVFSDAGYKTGLFGKWHLGDSFPYRPEDRGFDETVHHGAWGITSIADYWGNGYWNDTYHHNGVWEKYTGYCTDVWFDEAMTWMRARHDADEPFLAYIPTNVPHVPLRCDKRYSAPYEGKHNGLPMPAAFYGMIANFDENVGRLETFLAETGLRDNTILVFMTDNGSASKQAVAIHNSGMRGRKTENWDGGHRVPCFVRWPEGGLGKPRDIDDLTHMQDILPTLGELCDVKTPSNPDISGVSLAGMLKGKQKKLDDRMIVTQYGQDCAKWNRMAVMWNKWRLLGPDKLYDLATDPHQDTNVADRHPEVVKEMTAFYDSWRARVEPRFAITRHITLGNENANPTTLYGSDWDGDYCDNPGNLNKGTAIGEWDVTVERAGDYEIELRRWAEESELALAAPVNAKMKKSARPITQARLKIGDFDQTIETPKDSTVARFTVSLKAGKTRLATWFLDANDKPLVSAIYTKVTRK